MIRKLFGSLLGSTSEARMSAEAKIKEIIANNKVAVFSKSYCPFCAKAKRALDSVLGKGQYFVLEIENMPECSAYQDVLLAMTGGRSVPRVFIDGEFIGGGDETSMMASNGQLQKLLKDKNIL